MSKLITFAKQSWTLDSAPSVKLVSHKGKKVLYKQKALIKIDDTNHNVVGNIAAIGRLFPGAENVVSCPEGCSNAYYNGTSLAQPSLMETIIHMNDDHGLTREYIADWLETLDVDIRIKSDT